MKNRIQVLTLALAAVNAVASDADKNLVINSAPKVFDTTKYLCADLEGRGGIVELVDANTKKIEGITNFDGNRLDSGRYVAIDGIRILAENTNALTINTANWTATPAAVLLNSELQIFQGEDLFTIPCSELFNLHKGASTSNDEDFRQISHIPVLKPDVPFKINWKFPNGSSLPTDSSYTGFVKLEFRCHEVLFKK